MAPGALVPRAQDHVADGTQADEHGVGAGAVPVVHKLRKGKGVEVGAARVQSLVVAHGKDLGAGGQVHGRQLGNCDRDVLGRAGERDGDRRWCGRRRAA